ARAGRVPIAAVTNGQGVVGVGNAAASGRLSRTVALFGAPAAHTCPPSVCRTASSNIHRRLASSLGLGGVPELRQARDGTDSGGRAHIYRRGLGLRARPSLVARSVRGSRAHS